MEGSARCQRISDWICGMRAGPDSAHMWMPSAGRGLDHAATLINGPVRRPWPRRARLPGTPIHWRGPPPDFKCRRYCLQPTWIALIPIPAHSSPSGRAAHSCEIQMSSSTACRGRGGRLYPEGAILGADLEGVWGRAPLPFWPRLAPDLTVFNVKLSPQNRYYVTFSSAPPPPPFYFKILDPPIPSVIELLQGRVPHTCLMCIMQGPYGCRLMGGYGYSLGVSAGH